MRDLAREARQWLGFGDPPGGVGPPIPVPQEIIEAVTADDLGPAPVDLLRRPEWERISAEDREQIVRFARFVNAMGRKGGA